MPERDFLDKMIDKRTARNPEFSHLLDSASYEQAPARIVSAFATRKDPKSWSA